MDQVQNLLGRPKEYYNVDGVGELSIGFMCIGFAVLGWLQLHATRESAWHQMHAFVIYMGVMLAILHYGPKPIKTRIPYPRTGFVDYRPRDKYWIPMALGFVFSGLFSAAMYVAVRRHFE